MTCCSHCQGVEQFFDDKVARRQLRNYRRKGPGKATRRLIDAIAEDGVEGLTFIDIGGGVGAIQHDLMDRGAAGGTSADASPAYLAAARAEARSRGYAERIRYMHGDFVERATELEAADIVTLDRVVCCYPDMPAMLGAAARLAGRTLGLIIPRSTAFLRFGVALVNLIQRLRRHPFRIFVHDPGEVEAVLEGYGLSRHAFHEGMIWRMAVFGRTSQP